MEALVQYHERLLQQLKTSFRRDFMDEIDWKDRMIAIKGARGVGKTTLLLQRIKEAHGNDSRYLYVSLDHLYFSSNTLLALADEFSKTGGKVLYLDEIHKYHNWSQELKNINDGYPELKVVFTGSSVLHILKGKADLSRRAMSYDMEGLSFREFLQLETGKKFEKYSLSKLLGNHQEIARSIVARVKPLRHFSDYLKFGYYPFYLENRNTYSVRLMSTINLMMDIDVSMIYNIELRYIQKLKKLLYLIAITSPYQPNITKLAASIEVSRETIYRYLGFLQEAKLINMLRTKGSMYSSLIKPEKVYLNNCNLMYSIAPENNNKGNLRETFFFSQLFKEHHLEGTDQGDFLVDEKFTFEIGGKNKNNRQIKNVKNAFVTADMIEYGFANKIPLWLFGFLGKK